MYLFRSSVVKQRRSTHGSCSLGRRYLPFATLECTWTELGPSHLECFCSAKVSTSRFEFQETPTPHWASWPNWIFSFILEKIVIPNHFSIGRSREGLGWYAALNFRICFYFYFSSIFLCRIKCVFKYYIYSRSRCNSCNQAKCMRNAYKISSSIGQKEYLNCPSQKDHMISWR